MAEIPQSSPPEPIEDVMLALAGPPAWQPRGGGDMGAKIRSFDWSKTVVGPLDQWPMSLRIAVELCLNSRFPMFVWWGSELINIYNDAYAPLMGGRHPSGLGVSARELWKEIWSEIGPQTDAVLLRGQATWNHRRLLMLERNGYPEECYFTWSYSPILDDAGRVVGLFCSVTEETGQVMAERQRDELALRYAMQSRRFEKIFSSITDLAYVFDLQGRFVFANKPLLDIWGFTLEQALGKSFTDLNYPPELAGKLQSQIQQVIQTRQPLVDETSFTDRRGYTGYYEYIYSPVIGADGEVEAVAGVTRELTERRRLEQERRNLAETVERERAKLSSIIEQSPAFIAVLRGSEHVFEFANERFYDIAGRRDVIGKTLREAFPDIAGQGFDLLLDEVYRTGETFSADEIAISLARSDGTLDKRYMKVVYQVLRDSQQRNSGVFVHGVDITDVVVSRQALKDAEEFHRYAAEAGQFGSWNARLDTMEATFSPMMCKLMGMEARQVTMPFGDWFSHVVPEHRDGMRAAIATAIERDIPYEYEFEILMPDGSRRWLASRGGVTRDSTGKAVRLHGATVDVTERKRLALEREALLENERLARSQAEHASMAKDKFLAVLSHELRTPLSPVVMTIPALETDPALPSKFKDDLAMIRRNIELEVKLIDDLLDLGRITSGKLRLRMQSVRVHELLRHVMRSSQSDAATGRLRLRDDLTAANDCCLGDPARLQQVFWNLLRNAIKFTPADGQITLRTENSSDGSQLLVEVQDTGMGIPREVLPHIFDAFEQGDARMTRQFGGLGLGLAISKVVVEMHGGTITAASEGRDRGATFLVRLSTHTNQAGNVETSAVSPSAPPSRDQTVHVLLVEDHPDTSRTMTRLLRSFGYAVTTAQSVSGALKLLEDQTFHVLISDIGLPDASGYELMQQAKRRHHLTGIALSGYGLDEDIRKSREAGFSEHLIKPIDIAHLQAVLTKLVPR